MSAATIENEAHSVDAETFEQPGWHMRHVCAGRDHEPARVRLVSSDRLEEGDTYRTRFAFCVFCGQSWEIRVGQVFATSAPLAHGTSAPAVKPTTGLETGPVMGPETPWQRFVRWLRG